MHFRLGRQGSAAGDKGSYTRPDHREDVFYRRQEMLQRQLRVVVHGHDDLWVDGFDVDHGFRDAAAAHPSMHAIVGGDFVDREFGNIGPVPVSYMLNT